MVDHSAVRLPQTLGVPTCHPPRHFGVPSILLSEGPGVPPSPFIGSWSPARGGKRQTDKVILSIPLSRELGQERDQRDPDGFRPRVPAETRPWVLLGEPHRLRPHGEKSPLGLGVPSPSLVPGDTESPRHWGTTGGGTGALWVGRGFYWGMWCRGRGKGEAIPLFPPPPRCWYPSPPAATLPWPGRRKGRGRCALCPPPSGAGDCSRQQGRHFDTHILYSCKQHKSAWLLFP